MSIVGSFMIFCAGERVTSLFQDNLYEVDIYIM